MGASAGARSLLMGASAGAGSVFMGASAGAGSAGAGSAGAGSVVASMPSFLIRLRRWLSRCAQAVALFTSSSPCAARRRVPPPKLTR